MANIVSKKLWFFLISGILVLIAVISLVTFGLKPGIEFSSGSIVTINFEEEVTQEELEQELANLGFGNTLIQHTGSDDFIIRTHELTGAAKTSLENALTDTFGNLRETEFNSVSPMIATETTRNAAIAIAIASIGILLYVTWAFRRMPKPFHYGTCAIIALLHDTIIALGVFSILGGVLGWEINMMFITGILAVIGYSVNNTVVVFDRIRETQERDHNSSFETIVNRSLVETFSRSINTSLTTLFVVLALLFFVGVSIQNFSIVLLIGIIAGTFSSLCIAPLLLVVWEKSSLSRSTE
ncbi:protein translocase subunit SecF [Chloroflexota bacterium]